MLRSASAPGVVAVESYPGGARAAQNTMLEVEFAQISDNGRTRDHNEDYIGYVSPATPEEARTHGWLFALADGVGGHAHGEVALREGELGVNELSVQLKVEQSNLSQQLAVLRGRNIVAGRKEGNNVYYSVCDPEIFRLLDVAKKIFNNHLIDVRDMLSQLKTVRTGGR